MLISGSIVTTSRIQRHFAQAGDQVARGQPEYVLQPGERQVIAPRQRR